MAIWIWRILEIMSDLDMRAANSNRIKPVLIPELRAANKYWDDAVAVNSGAARRCACAARFSLPLNNLDATLGTLSQRLGRRWAGYHMLRNNDLGVLYAFLLSHSARHRSGSDGTSLHILLIAFRK